MAFSLPGILAKVASGAGSGLLSGAGDLVDACLSGKINRDTLDAKIKELAQSHADNITNQVAEAYKADLDDVASARTMNAVIQTTNTSSWLSKNTKYIIECLVISIWATLTCYLVFRMLNIISSDPKVDLVPILGVYTGVTSIAMVIMTFEFGSSASSQKHSDALTEIAKNSQN